MYDITFPPQSNRADFNFAIGITDKITGDGLDLSGRTITFDICDQNGCQIITFSTASLIQVDIGVFWWSVPAATMSALCPGTYPTGCVITKDDDGQKTQLSVGSLPVYEGNVR